MQLEAWGGWGNSLPKLAVAGSTTESWAVGPAGCMGHPRSLTWCSFPRWHMITHRGNANIQFWPSLFESTEGELGGKKRIIIPFPFFSFLNQQAWPSRLLNSTGLLFLFSLHPSGNHQYLKLCCGGSPVWQVSCSAAGKLQTFSTRGLDSERLAEVPETGRIRAEGAEGLSLGRRDDWPRQGRVICSTQNREEKNYISQGHLMLQL